MRKSLIKREDIRIRDPFILVEGDTYYMYGTIDLTGNSYETACRFSVYKSKDLENFEGPFVVFDGEKEGFWATQSYWAAEVWKYNDKFYLFGSVLAEGCLRATQIFVSDSPLGMFKSVSINARTPKNMQCLDGTLWVENGVPYMVFCHEWTQCGDGEICALQLTENMDNVIGEPFVLFKASDNPFVTEITHGNLRGYVTDGPFLFREKGKVKIIWSSFHNGRYVLLEAESDGIKGEWVHYDSRFNFEGGHAMIFTGLDEKKYISMHCPNKSLCERAVFIPYEETKTVKSMSR